MYCTKFLSFTAALVCSVAASPLHAASQATIDLEVDNAPNDVRPYVMRHYATASAVTIGAQLYRFYVTGNSSGGAFTLLSTNAPTSVTLGVLPHIHQRHHENFYNYKGRFQVWTQKDEEEQQTRVLEVGDYGAVPRNTTHTFQVLGPDTEMLGSIAPGGFEALFFAQGIPLTNNSVHSAYVPQFDNSTSAAGPNSTIIAALEALDVYAQLDFQTRSDTVNGSAPAGADWHTAANDLGATGEPYFVADGMGPKYLNDKYGYQIIAPLATPDQTQDTNFTLSIISIGSLPNGTAAPSWTLTGATAWQVLEGELTVRIAEHDAVVLTSGDVAFLPANTEFSYWTEGYFTKIYNINGGHEGLDQTLIKGGEPYDFVTFPIAFTSQTKLSESFSTSAT